MTWSSVVSLVCCLLSRIWFIHVFQQPKEYLIKWAGYTRTECKWEPQEHIPEHLIRYILKYGYVGKWFLTQTLRWYIQYTHFPLILSFNYLQESLWQSKAKSWKSGWSCGQVPMLFEGQVKVQVAGTNIQHSHGPWYLSFFIQW